MDDIRLRYAASAITGVPDRIKTGQTEQNGTHKSEKSAFQDILRDTIEKTSTVNFSNHAIKRAADHGIQLTHESLERLNEGVKLANDKNLEDTLILVDGTAFIVNAKNNTVITAVNKNESKGNVFTNIEGTVIV